MQHEHVIRRIMAKETTLFFSSPVAYLFLATFAAVTLFIFFWGETFFARNIADVRPLFEWMPILLIFLTSALTMRMWSEERRSGTLEHVLTQPIPIWKFVAGKFFACMVLLVIALLITLPLPITVSIIGDLDWGPVWSGYLATILLGAAYISVGLFVSARSDNQIVSLIIAVAVCGLLYLIGSPAITDFFGNQAGEWLRELGTGSRFTSITRGVIDIRDFYYYFSLIAVFLALNTFSLERERWATTGDKQHHSNWRIATTLLIVNALAVNVWLGQINVLRLDTTQGKIYSISHATRNYLAQLQEPLLIRGYFSAKTHPLLAPLVPQLKDLIREFAVAGKGKVHVEFVDPETNPAMEKEANQKYGIEPTPFQVANRYQSSVVNSYFNVLIKYGDQFQTLGFRDLIDVKSQSAGHIDVELRNPEYDITRALKKVLLAYQSGGNLFDTVKGDLNFTGYISADSQLPKQLVDYKAAIQKTLSNYEKQSHGRLKVNFIEPEANGGQVARQIMKDYGFKPMLASLVDPRQFYFYLTLGQKKQIVRLPLGNFTASGFKQSLEAGIKRFATGFTKTVALVTPSPSPNMNSRFNLGDAQYNQLKRFLGTDLKVKQEDLKNGKVDSDADVLMLASPKDLNTKQLFAIDQFLMRGGTVIAATSPFTTSMTHNSLMLTRHSSGLGPWLAHYGIKLEPKLVLDPQNSAFPTPVTRNMGGYSFQEMRMLDYPYFPDIRGTGLNQNNSITSGLNDVTMAWASPIDIDKKLNADRKVTDLLQSSDKSWTSSSLNIMPQIGPDGRSHYMPEGKQGKQLLGVIVQGQFDSYFAGKDSPLLSNNSELASNTDDKTSQADSHNNKDPIISSVIQHSPGSARIIVYSSNEFLSDQVTRLLGARNGSNYLDGLQLAANTLDWSLEDAGLLSIRSRGHFNRTLPPMKKQKEIFWESSNYVMAIVLLVLLALWQGYKRRQRSRRYTDSFAV